MTEPGLNGSMAGQVRERVQRVRAAVKGSPEIMRAIAEAAAHIIVKRTYEDGLDLNGSPFPEYSTKRMYIGPSSEYFNLAGGGGRTDRVLGPGGRGVVFSYKPVKGDSGKTRRTSSKKLRSVAYDGGWAEFKAGLNQGGAAVNLTVRGTMLGALGQERPFEPVEVRDDYVAIDFTRPKERLKAEGNHNRGRRFFGVGHVPGELELLAKVAMKEWGPAVTAAWRGA